MDDVFVVEIDSDPSMVHDIAAVMPIANHLNLRTNMASILMNHHCDGSRRDKAIKRPEN